MPLLLSPSSNSLTLTLRPPTTKSSSSSVPPSVFAILTTWRLWLCSLALPFVPYFRADNLPTQTTEASKKFVLNVQPCFFTPLLPPILEAIFNGKRIRTNRSTRCTARVYPICPYYAIRAHVHNQFILIFYIFPELFAVTAVNFRRFSQIRSTETVNIYKNQTFCPALDISGQRSRKS